MAKKDRLKNLIGAIKETPTQEQPQEKMTLREDKQPLPSVLVQELGISPEMEEKLNKARLSKRGRPKGRGNGNPNRENRATFIVDRDITRKLKYIALMETRTYKAIVGEALQEYIDRWESKNETINLPKSKDNENS